MENAPIKFNQERDFGEIFNASIAFIRQELKPLGKAVLIFVLPILLIAAILTVFIGIEQQKIISAMSVDNAAYMSNPFAILGSTLKYSLLTLLAYALGITSLRCTIYGYIKLYVTKGKDQFSLDDVWLEIKKFFFPVLGSSIVIGLIVGIGFVFCIIPGIYLGISLSLFYFAFMFENKGFSNAFGRSFDLTKQNWWLTLGLILVAYIIVYLITLLLSIPAIILGFKSAFTSFKNLQEGTPMNFTTGYYILSSITNLINYILFSVPFVVIAFQYFSLLESKEKPSLQDKIDQIG